MFSSNNTRGCLFYKGGAIIYKGGDFFFYGGFFFWVFFLIFPDLLIFVRFFEVQDPMQRWALFWPFFTRVGYGGGGLLVGIPK